jgi:enoyl-CoA hydratase
MQESGIEELVGDQIAEIRIRGAEKNNALGIGVIEKIGGLCKRFAEDPNVRVVHIRSEGANFSTGADIGEVEKASHCKAELKEFLERGHRAFTLMEDSAIPIVVSVQGLCLAGGLELVLACDVVIAGESSRFGDQHSHFGFIPGWGGSQRLVRQIGITAALDLLYSARWISAGEAKSHGLITKVVPDSELDNASKSYCRNLVSKSPRGLQTIKKLVREGSKLGWPDRLRLEIEEATIHLQSADAKEGFSAFSSNRPPKSEIKKSEKKEV